METQSYNLVHFNKARQELALANNVDEVKVIRDKAEALRVYAKQAGESLVMQNMCAEIKLRAERRGGELLTEQIPHEGGRPSEKPYQRGRVSKQKLSDLGINYNQSSRWQQIADIPEESFDEHIATVKGKGRELTTSSVIRLSRDIREKKVKEEVRKTSAPIGKYETIVIDPPWPVQKILRDVAPNQDVLDYPTMAIEEITAIDIAEIADVDCHLFLWATQKYLPTAMDIVKTWGFKYVLTMVWKKSGGFQPFGLPQYNCEFVIYGRKGSPKFLDTKNFFCCFDGARREHSRKPEEFDDILRRVTPSPRIDYFSREEKDGFISFGNETTKFSKE